MPAVKGSLGNGRSRVDDGSAGTLTRAAGCLAQPPSESRRSHWCRPVLRVQVVKPGGSRSNRSASAEWRIWYGDWRVAYRLPWTVSLYSSPYRPSDMIAIFGDTIL